jgi:hypothetical protein
MRASNITSPQEKSRQLESSANSRPAQRMERRYPFNWASEKSAPRAAQNGIIKMVNSAAVELLTGKNISMIMPPEHVHNHNTIIIVLRATLTASSTMVTLLFINNGLNILDCLHIFHNISTHHTDNGK